MKKYRCVVKRYNERPSVAEIRCDMKRSIDHLQNAEGCGGASDAAIVAQMLLARMMLRGWSSSLTKGDA